MEQRQLNKIINLLLSSKEHLDETLEATREHLEAVKDVASYEGMLQADIDFAKEEGVNADDEIARTKARLAEAIRERDKTLERLTTLGKSLEDYLGSAGRVSDHFNGKKYPLGMTPL